MALGADRGNVLLMVFRGAFAPVGLGLAVGIPVAFLAGRFWTTNSMEYAPMIHSAS
jgi:hypothetical protein